MLEVVLLRSLLTKYFSANIKIRWIVYEIVLSSSHELGDEGW